MESNENQSASQKGQSSSKQKTGKSVWEERQYIKDLGGVWDFSRAGQSFVTSLSKPSLPTTSISDSKDLPNTDQDMPNNEVDMQS